ncbi:hypothetical protein QL285_088589 [Trifolium repens]|nr:hypothetical protein QL285_088589 [Trifolium repens]
MKRIGIFNIIVMALTLMAIVPKIDGHAMSVTGTGTNPRPLCPSQFALVNYACGRLPFSPAAPPEPVEPPPAPPSPDDDGGDDDGGDDDDDDDDDGGDDDGGDDDGGDDGGDDLARGTHHRNHGHGNGRGHGQGHGKGHGQGHGRHGHRHRHRHHRRGKTPEEENCCRWAKEVDNQCVCELLVRLPPFLVRPPHKYTLTIGEDCEVTYSCGGPI